MRPRTRLLVVPSMLIYAFLYAPIAIVILFAFNSSRYGLIWSGFTTEWFRTLARDPQALSAIRNTVLLAAVSTCLSTVIGTLLGYGLERHDFPGKRFLARLLFVPVFIPDIILAVALLLLYATVRTWTGWFQLGLGTMILGHVTFQIPFVTIVVRSRLAGLDRSLEEAAQDLGADAFKTFLHVTLPLIMPGVLAGAALAFTLSLDDFVVSFFTSGPGSTTLPIFIYSSVRRGITPEINALSTLIIAASVTSTLCLALLQRGRFRSV